MKTLLAVALLAGSLQASMVPAGQVVTSAGLTPIRDRVAARVAYQALNGFHYAEVDMDGVSFNEQNMVAHELTAMGYRVELCNDRHVFGWNALNGGLLIRWK